MSIKNWPGGYIKPIPPTPAGPFENGAASGMWTLEQVAYWQKQGLWPVAGNIAPFDVRLLIVAGGGAGGRDEGGGGGAGGMISVAAQEVEVGTTYTVIVGLVVLVTNTAAA